MKLLLKKIFGSLLPRIALLSLLISLILPIGILLPTNPARAQIGGLDPTNSGDVTSFHTGVDLCLGVSYLMSLIPGSATRVPIDDLPTWMKEQLLDCIIFQLKNTIIADMTNTTVQYAARGIDGNPIFANNLTQLFTNAANQVAGEFIGTQLEFLCSPFRGQIQLALARAQQNYQGNQYQCTLTDVVENIDEFLNGDFLSGGWEGWFSLTQSPQNNPYGAYVSASGELAEAIAAATGIEREKLEQGSGFLSKEVCEEIPGPPDANGNGPGQICKTVTPGSVIMEQLNGVLGSGLRQLELADEINETVNLLFAYLISDILTSDSGLAGYNSDDFEHELPDIEIPSFPGTGPTTPNDSEPPGPPGPSTCFVANGTFLEPTQQNPEGHINLPLPQNTSYNRVELELDITHGGWHPTTANPRYNAFWLVRARNRNMFGYLPINGPSQNNITLRHGIGQVHASKVKKVANATLQPGETYHFKYIYDVTSDEIDLRVTNSGSGNTVAHLTSEPDVPGINVGREQFLVGFSFPYPYQEGNPLEVPSLGWKYKNLRVSFLSTGDTPTSCIQTSVSAGPGGEIETEPPSTPGGGPRPPAEVEVQ